ncbi:MAG: hypothetical protein PHF86_03330 [Candidatus Nanoarchaeia archaeon]|jgi:hypothetical protein|nr:hypothetical protein [Candidatus Nanoarchaeia archaeon]
MKEYTVYLIAFKNLKFKCFVKASSIHVASEIAKNRAKVYKKVDWTISMIWSVV